MNAAPAERFTSQTAGVLKAAFSAAPAAARRAQSRAGETWAHVRKLSITETIEVNESILDSSFFVRMNE